jgi:glucose-fructose oxidoreductase
MRPDIFREVDETTQFQLRFPSGAVADLNASFGKNQNFLDVKAEKGWFKLEPFQAYSGVHGSSSNGPINLPGGNEQAKQMDDDALAIMNKKPLIAPGEEGMRDIRVIEAIYQAGRTNQPVTLK